MKEYSIDDNQHLEEGITRDVNGNAVGRWSMK